MRKRTTASPTDPPRPVLDDDLGPLYAQGNEATRELLAGIQEARDENRKRDAAGLSPRRREQLAEEEGTDV
jgi:hypothetical protein